MNTFRVEVFHVVDSDFSEYLSSGLMEPGLLLKTFRQGWLLNVHKIVLVSNIIDEEPQPYLVYAIKSRAEDLAPVKWFLGSSQNPSAGTQVRDESQFVLSHILALCSC